MTAVSYDYLSLFTFDAVVDGCQGVFHTPSPVLLSVTDPQGELLDPAVKGTLNVLQSCAKFPSIKRVVLTSSIASVMMTGVPLTSDVVLDETWYSDPLFCEKHKQWYFLSKTLAEETAWKFAKGNGIDLVSLNPGHTIDPLLQPTLNFSIELLQNIMSGTQTPTINPFVVVNSFVDVRDVASAHIQAFEIPSASGRYCLVGQVADDLDTLKILRQLYPTLTLAEVVNPSDSKHQVSKEKARGLGITFLPLETSLGDTIESLKEKGFLKI
ncbi:hypothetical protein ACFX2G_029157 [Malus domestica]